MAPVEFIERDGFAFVASDAEVQFRAKSNKPQQTTQHKHESSSEVSPGTNSSSTDAEATLSFAAFAPDAKPPAFQDTKNSSRSACADLQAASQSLSEVLKQVDAVLAQSAASPVATASHVILPSPSLRRVSVSNIVSTFEQNKVSPPITIVTRENKRTSFPPPSQPGVADTTSDSPVQKTKEPEVTLHTSPPSDWTIVNSPAQATAVQSNVVMEDTTIITSIAHQLPSPPSPEAAVINAASDAVYQQKEINCSTPSNHQIATETIPIHISPKSIPVLERLDQACAPVTIALSSTPKAASATATTQPGPVQLSSVPQSYVLASAATITAPPPPAGARYTFEDVERITTFAKEELQRRADSEVAALTAQLAAKASQAQALCDENAVLKDTLLQ